MQAVCKAVSVTETIPKFHKAKKLYIDLRHLKPGKDKEVVDELSLDLVQKTFADLQTWVSSKEVLGIARQPVYDDNGRCQGEKAQTGAWCWKRSQGRPLLAFISTLDGVSSTRIIAPGWKRSAFAFS